MVGIVDILNQWQSVGVFDYVLPFLLIFSIVFGILTSTNIIGKQKGVHVIIALVVGLLALRLPLVPMFFAQVFPRLGVALAAILSLLILTGLFIAQDETRYWLWGFALVAVVAWIFVLVGSSQSLGWLGLVGNLSDYAGLIIGTILLIGVIIAVVSTKGSTASGATERKTFQN